MSEDDPTNDYPEMNEDNLQTIKNRWDTDRNKLTTNYSLDSYYDEDYYINLDDLEGNDLMLALRAIISVMIPISYGDARFVLEKSDVKHSIYGSYLYGFYDGKKLVRYWDNAVTGVTATMDREHVWPKSYLNGGTPDNNTKNITSDIHNLRAILSSTNSSRSNRYFVDGSGGNYIVGNNSYYPGDNHKGDVARILLYMIVRYPQLSLVDDFEEITGYGTYNANATQMGLLDVLLRWHEEDEVDGFERQRNDVIYTYQGNRNPFIDHPEYVSMIWEVQDSSGQTHYIAMTFVNTDLNLGDFKQREEWFA